MSRLGDAFDAWAWDDDTFRPPVVDLARCSACGEWTEAAALFVTVDDRRVCEACKADNLHLAAGEAP